jgi:hypothetical protein
MTFESSFRFPVVYICRLGIKSIKFTHGNASTVEVQNIDVSFKSAQNTENKYAKFIQVFKRPLKLPQMK